MSLQVRFGKNRARVSLRASWCRSLYQCAVGAVIATLPICTIGCAPKPPAFNDVLTDFQQPKALSQNQIAKSTRVFVDCSTQMSGFVVQGSNYVRALQALSKGISNAGMESLWYCATAPPSDPAAHVPPSPLSIQELLSERMYHTAPNPLGETILLSQSLARPGGADAIDAFISDLSTSGTAIVADHLAMSLRNWAKSGRQVMLWAFRSSYRGTYLAGCSECVGRSMSIKIGQSLPGLGRPFYLIVSAPDRDSLEKWARSLRNELSPSREFNVSDPVPDLVDLERIEIDTGNDKSVHRLSQITEKASDHFRAQRLYSVFEVDHAKPFSVAFASTYRSALPLAWSNVTPVTSLARPGSKQAETTGEVKVVLSTVRNIGPNGKQVSQPQTEKVRIEYTFPAQSSGWKLYRVTISDGPYNTPLPEWMKNWETLQDCEPTNGNRTFGLHAFGTALAEAFHRDQLFTEHYFAVRQR